MTQYDYDLIIIGGGPAGYSAGIYAARAALNILVIEQGMPGGQIATSDMIDNYPGIPSISGVEIGSRIQSHAEQAGAKTAYAMVEALDRDDEGIFTVTTNTDTFRAPSIIMATGASPRPAGFDGEEKFRGRGVSYCATCDGMFYRNKTVFVIGGGNSAVEEAIYLSHVAKEVIMVVRRDAFRASKGMVRRLQAIENISIRYLTSIEKLDGETMPATIVFRDNSTGHTYTESLDPGSFGIFVFTGTTPNAGLITHLVDTTESGAVVANERMETKTDGLFVAGDIRDTVLRQVITAASDGAVAATSAYRYLDHQGYI